VLSPFILYNFSYSIIHFIREEIKIDDGFVEEVQHDDGASKEESIDDGYEVGTIDEETYEGEELTKDETVEGFLNEISRVITLRIHVLLIKDE
jgi:hypothetical protein